VLYLFVGSLDIVLHDSLRQDSVRSMQCVQSRRKGPPYPPAGGTREKGGPPNLTEYRCYGI